MGDAADDVFDAALKNEMTEGLMLAAGCRHCTERHGDEECPVCHDLGWIDRNGEPCEP